MKYIYRSFLSMWVTFRNIFRKPVTDLQFPRTRRERADRYRTSFALVHDEHGEEACIACKKCQMICPSDIITVVAGKKAESPRTGKSRGYLDDFTLDMNACIFCELCVQVCPTDAILMTRNAPRPEFSREDLFLTREKLFANEPMVTWATATKLAEMQDPDRGQDKPASAGEESTEAEAS